MQRNCKITTYKSALYISIAIMLLGLIITGIQPHDRLTWYLVVFPVIIVIPILFCTYNKFPLTNLLYYLIAIHAVILMIGGHYTYARVPFGFWLENILHLTRNPYDRIGHFAQGFIPAIALRELLLRTSNIGKSKWLPTLIIASFPASSAANWAAEVWLRSASCTVTLSRTSCGSLDGLRTMTVTS